MKIKGKEKIILMLVFVLIMQVLTPILMPISKAADVLEKGDVNADKSINVQDLIKVKTHILGGATLTEEEKLRADMNLDNSINIQDVVLLKVKILENVIKDRYTEILEELQEILEDKIEDGSAKITLEEYLKELIEKGIIDETDIVEGEDENTKIVIVENQYVYEVKVNEDGEIEIEYKGLIEILSPEIRIEDSIVTTTTITIKVETERNVEGKVQYLIKEDGAEEYQLAKETTDLTYTFTNLTSNKKYNVKVVAVSNNGKTAEDVLDITTKAEPKPEIPETPDTPVEPEIPDNTDKIAPILEVTGNVTEWTNKDVVLTIKASDETALKEVTVNGQKVTLTNGQVQYTVTKNGTYTVVVVDNAENKTTKEIIVNKIDKTEPILEVTGNATELTNKDVVLTIKASDETELDKVTVNGTELIITNGQVQYTVTKNGTYTIVATDNAENKITKEITVNKIDKIAPTLKVTYSTEQKTNQNVKVIIESNEEIKAVNGWTLSSDKKKLEKEYSSNMNETIKVYDLAGNYSEKTINVTNIDKTAPTLKVTYSPTQKTNQNVKVTIESNKEIQAVSGWTLSSDKRILTKVYTANMSETVKVYDLGGNYSQTTINVTNIDKTAPTCTITASSANTTNANTITYLFTWSEAVTGFTADDIAITGIGTKVNFSGSGNEYRLIVTTQANQNGTQTVSIVAGKCTDLAGNSNSAASKSITIDKTAPGAGNFKVIDIDKDRFTIFVQGYDGESGINKIIWYYKASTEKYNFVETDINNDKTAWRGYEKTIEGLNYGNYTAYAEIYDAAGNKTATETISFEIEHTYYSGDGQDYCKRCEKISECCGNCGLCYHCHTDAHTVTSGTATCNKCERRDVCCTICGLCTHCYGASHTKSTAPTYWCKECGAYTYVCITCGLCSNCWTE